MSIEDTEESSLAYGEMRVQQKKSIESEKLKKNSPPPENPGVSSTTLLTPQLGGKKTTGSPTEFLTSATSRTTTEDPTVASRGRLRE